MSLLMKALEKAAKDRGDAQQVPPEPAPVGVTAAAPGSKPLPTELTLEPLQADAPSPPPPPPPKAPTKPAPADRERARAATVMQATAAPVSGSRIPPVLIIGVISGVIALGLAIYFYLQITNPGLFISRPPVMPRPPAPLVQAPAPVQQPIATGTVVAPATPAPPQVAAAPAPEPSPPRTQRATPRAPATAAATATATSNQAARDTIRVSPGATEPQLDPRLPQAYAALQSGKLDAARQLYGDAVRNEPRNINALLGLAAVAMQENRTEEASRLYFNVLDLEPRNAYAQAGLIAMLGRADPASAEAKLKQLISREPLASLYFTLGNLYGDQSRWAEAQQAYFQAYQLESANPDYAYNLAVGLEHVGQTKLAVGYYRRAVAQAQGRGRVGFNLAQAQDRILQLAARPE